MFLFQAALSGVYENEGVAQNKKATSDTQTMLTGEAKHTLSLRRRDGERSAIRSGGGGVNSDLCGKNELVFPGGKEGHTHRGKV